MISHGIKCRHCHSNMSEPKLVQDGPKKGMMRSYCLQCGHMEHAAADSQAQTSPQQPKPYNQQQGQPQLTPFGARLISPRKPL